MALSVLNCSSYRSPVKIGGNLMYKLTLFTIYLGYLKVVTSNMSRNVITLYILMLQKYVSLEQAHDELKKSFLEQETVSTVYQFPNNVIIIRKYSHTLGTVRFVLNF